MGDEADAIMEWGDPHWDDPLLDDYQPAPITFVKCKTCGKGGLTWERKDGRWVLYDGEEKHVCDYKQYFNGLRGVHSDLG